MNLNYEKEPKVWLTGKRRVVADALLLIAIALLDVAVLGGEVYQSVEHLLDVLGVSRPSES